MSGFSVSFDAVMMSLEGKQEQRNKFNFPSEEGVRVFSLGKGATYYIHEDPSNQRCDFIKLTKPGLNANVNKVYYAPYPAEGRALPKAMNGRGWVGCICIFFAF